MVIVIFVYGILVIFVMMKVFVFMIGGMICLLVDVVVFIVLVVL